MMMFYYWSSIIILLLSIMIGLMKLMVEIPITTSTNDVILTNKNYNMIEIIAPVLSGYQLSIFTYIVRYTYLRPFIIRYLLNKNDIHLVRQLASKLKLNEEEGGISLYPTYYPIKRLSHEEHMYHTTKAGNDKHILTTGLPLSRTLSNNTTSTTTTYTTTSYRSIMDYYHLYETHRATPNEVIDEVINGIQQLNPKLHFMKDYNIQTIREQAKASTERWKSGNNTTLSILDGIPIAFKDQVNIKGHLNCLGSQFCIFAKNDDPMVAKFRNGGAIIIGTTVMTEGGVTPLGYNVWSNGPYNPYDTNYYSGGSSSGSAVIVSCGIIPISIGFDGGGSIRIPSSMTGVYGLASTFGRIETNSGLHSTNVKAGPIGATIHDVALTHLFLNNHGINKTHYYSQLYDGGVLGIPPAHLDGYYYNDSSTSTSTSSSTNDNTNVVEEQQSQQLLLKDIKVGIYWDHFEHSDKEVVTKCHEVVKFMKEELGVTIINITIPYIRQIHLSHGIKILSEFATTWDKQFYNSSKNLEDNTIITLLMGKALTANEVLAADKIRTWAINYMSTHIFNNVDVIISPTLGTKVPKPHKGYHTNGESNTPLVYKVMRYVTLANFLGYPSISIPIGYEDSKTKLPIGLQLTSNSWNEHIILKISSILENTYIQHIRQTPPSTNFYDPLKKWLN